MGILIALMLFSGAWYLGAEARGVGFVQEDTAEASSVDDQGAFYLLVIGSDTRRGTALYTGNPGEEGQTTEHADVLTLVRVDPDERIVTLLSIPSDTLVVDGSQKVNSLLVAGDPFATIAEVEKLTGVEIPYYLVVTFAGFETLVDAIGGVTIDVSDDVTMQDPGTGTMVSVKAGKDKTLDGAQALAVASAWENSGKREVVRQMNVRAIEQSLIEQVGAGDEKSIRRALGVLGQSASTNMDHGLLVSLALDYAANRKAYTIYAGSGPYRGMESKTGEWVVARDPSTWTQVMAAVDAGEDPNDVVKVVAPKESKKTEAASSSSAAGASSSQKGSAASSSQKGSAASSSSASSASSSAKKGQ